MKYTQFLTRNLNLTVKNLGILHPDLEIKEKQSNKETMSLWGLFGGVWGRFLEDLGRGLEEFGGENWRF